MYALSQFGPLASAALPRLHEIATRDLSHDAYMALLAIKEIDPREGIGPRLREFFLSGEKGVRANAATRLPDHLPAAEAREILMAQYERESNDEMRSIIAQAMNRIKE